MYREFLFNDDVVMSLEIETVTKEKVFLGLFYTYFLHLLRNSFYNTTLL